jgi:hypothetical protein
MRFRLGFFAPTACGLPNRWHPSGRANPLKAARKGSSQRLATLVGKLLAWRWNHATATRYAASTRRSNDLAELKLLRVELSENKARTFVLTMKGRAQAAKLVASSTIAMSGSTPSHNPPEPGVTTPAAGATVTPSTRVRQRVASVPRPSSVGRTEMRAGKRPLLISLCGFALAGSSPTLISSSYTIRLRTGRHTELERSTITSS